MSWRPSSKCPTSGRQGLNTETLGLRSLEHYMTLEEAVAVNRISREGNRPCLLSDDHEWEACRRLTRSTTLGAYSLQDRLELANSPKRVVRSNSAALRPRRRAVASSKTVPRLPSHYDSSIGLSDRAQRKPLGPPASRWDKLPAAFLLKVQYINMQQHSVSSSPSAACSGDSSPRAGGNCKDLLVAASVCRSWRATICKCPGLLQDIGVSIDVTRPFTSKRVVSRVMRFMECPPFPLMIRKAADAGNPSACYAIAALLDLQGLNRHAVEYWKQAAQALPSWKSAEVCCPQERLRASA